MRIHTKELAPELWPQLVQLFGKNGACGGCWCQAWRIGPGESWKEIQGVKAKRRLRRGVEDGTTFGVIAFAADVPVGWCSFGPRLSFPRLERARTIRCDDAEQVWSITCFFVARGFRGVGVATALLKHAIRVMKRHRAKIVEGYPSKPDKNGRYVDTFAWTGTQSLFNRAGFSIVGNKDGGRQRVRKALRVISAH